MSEITHPGSLDCLSKCFLYLSRSFSYTEGSLPKQTWKYRLLIPQKAHRSGVVAVVTALTSGLSLNLATAGAHGNTDGKTTATKSKSANAQPAGEPKAKKSKQLVEGWRCMKLKDWHGAIRVANEGISAEPDNKDLFNLRGGAYLNLKKRELALADFTSSLKIQPQAEIYTLRSDLYRELGQPALALKDIREAIKLNPTASYQLKEADRQLDLGDLDACLASAKKALAMQKTEPESKREEFLRDCYGLIGHAYLGKKEPQKALEAFCKSLDYVVGWTTASKSKNRKVLLAQAQEHSDIILLQGEAYEKLGNLRAAIFDYELAVEAHPKSFEYRRSLLRIYRKANQNDKALSLVTQLLSVDDSPDLYYKRAEIYKTLGNADLAKVDTERAQKIEYGIMGSLKPR